MTIAENIARIRANMAAAAREAGRDPADITLEAATKVQTSETIRAAIAAGITVCGENRVQELTAHLADYAYDGARVHFIGHLQTNKVKYVVGRVDLIESVDSPRLLDRYYRVRGQERIMFAGQITGVEGYVESAASGFLVGIETARRLKGQSPVDFPREMAIGALALYISNESVTQFQPMNINFGIIPPLDHRVKGKRNKNAELSQRSLAIIEARKEEILS